MTVVFNAVPTTCTAKLLTGWAMHNELISNDEKVKLRKQLEILKYIDTQSSSHSNKSLKYLLDFAIIHLFVTEQQMKYCKEVIELMGFKMVFEGRKDHDSTKQREQGTGTLYLWANDPYTWRNSTLAAIKTIEARLAIIDPPKKPDPERQKWPALRGIRGKVVRVESQLQNRVGEVLIVQPQAAAIYIRNHFGFDPREWKGRGDAWLNLTISALRREHEAWKAELV